MNQQRDIDLKKFFLASFIAGLLFSAISTVAIIVFGNLFQLFNLLPMDEYGSLIILIFSCTFFVGFVLPLFFIKTPTVKEMREHSKRLKEIIKTMKEEEKRLRKKYEELKKQKGL